MRLLMLLGLSVGLVPAAGAAKTGRPPEEAEVEPDNMVANVPGLAEALARQGWTAVPSRTGGYQVGNLFRATGSGFLRADKCFPDVAPPQEVIVDASIVQRMKASGNVRLGVA